MNILDELYSGEGVSISSMRPNTRRYSRACNKVQELKMKISEYIPIEEQEILNQFELALYNETEEEVKQAYKYGFVSGMKLKEEVDEIADRF